MRGNIGLTGTIFFFSSRRRHTRWPRDWSSDVCSSDLKVGPHVAIGGQQRGPIEKRRDEYQEHELRVELHRGEPRDHGDQEAAHNEQRGGGELEATRHQRQEGDADEQREDGFEIVHGVCDRQSYLPACLSQRSSSISTARSSTPSSSSSARTGTRCACTAGRSRRTTSGCRGWAPRCGYSSVSSPTTPPRSRPWWLRTARTTSPTTTSWCVRTTALWRRCGRCGIVARLWASSPARCGAAP